MDEGGITLSFILHPLSFSNVAERVGFEPTEPVKAHSISNAANSTALAPFQKLILRVFLLRLRHLP